MKLTCAADGAPTPFLSWKNTSGKVIKKVRDVENIVHVQMTSDQDFGNYTCEATNDVNTDTSTVQVQQISKWNIYCSLVVYQYLRYTYKRRKHHSVTLPFRQWVHILFFNLRKHQGIWIPCSLTFTWSKNTLSIITSSERLNSRLSSSFTLLRGVFVQFDCLLVAKAPYL